jgi:hypothetical protein
MAPTRIKTKAPYANNGHKRTVFSAELSKTHLPPANHFNVTLLKFFKINFTPSANLFGDVQ